MKRTLVVVPTYNEAENVGDLVRSLMEHDGVDVIVVDDGSPDGTGDVVDALRMQWPDRLTLMRRVGKGGRGASVLAGFRTGIEAGGYKSFVEMDADLSHLPQELPRLIDAASTADVVIGSRYAEGGSIVGWSMRRRLWSRASNGLIHLFLRLPVTDYTNGYRLYSAEAVRYLLEARLRERGYISLSEWALELHRHGMRFANVATTFVNRRYGQSKMSFSEAAGAIRGLVRMRLAANRS